MIRMRNLIIETVMDLDTAHKLAKRIDKEVKVPFVQSQVSTLGGQYRPSVMVRISLDPKSSWTNGIYQNSRYSQFQIAHDGVIEQFSYYGLSKKFRKTTFKTPDEVITKLNNYIGQVK